MSDKQVNRGEPEEKENIHYECSGNCCCHQQDNDDEEDEKKEKIRNIILFSWGVLCLIVGFIFEKTDSSAFKEFSWSFLSNSDFYKSFSFISLILYTVGYIPLMLTVAKESLEEIKEGNIFNENVLMLISTLGAYGICAFPEALFVVLFSIVGEALEDYATSKSKKSIKNLINNTPLFAHLVNEDGTIEEKQPEELLVGDIIEIKPGEKIPVDGIIVKGNSSLDLSSINGESMPKDVTINSQAFSGSLNISSVIQLKVEKEYKDSTLTKILDLVENQQSQKANTERFITKFAKYYTPTVMVIALAVFIIGFGLSGWNWTTGGSAWLYKALSILLISCPCALVISVPITFFAGIGSASKLGILIKGSIALEKLSSVDTFAFDKTGTLTKGEFALMNTPKEEYLTIAASLESKSTHPLGKVIVDSNKNKLLEVNSLTNIPGYGIKGVINSKTYYIGSKELLINNGIKDIKQIDTPYKILYLGEEQEGLLETFIVADQIKDETKLAIAELKKSKVKNTVILSGDEQKIVDEVKSSSLIDQAYGDLLPDQKLVKLDELKRSHAVCYCGDGINDSPSILAADVGIAMGALGSDAAIEASDIVIMDDNIIKVAEARLLANRTMTIARLVIALSLILKLIVMVLVMAGVLGEFAMIVSGLSDTGVMIICLCVALTMMFYKAKLIKK